MIVMTIIIYVTVSFIRMERCCYAVLLGIKESPINKNIYKD